MTSFLKSSLEKKQKKNIVVCLRPRWWNNMLLPLWSQVFSLCPSNEKVKLSKVGLTKLYCFLRNRQNRPFLAEKKSETYKNDQKVHSIQKVFLSYRSHSSGPVQTRCLVFVTASTTPQTHGQAASGKKASTS